MALLFHELAGVLPVNQLDANHLENSRFYHTTVQSDCSHLPIRGVIGATLMGWYMDKLNPTTVIKYSYLSAFALLIIAGLVSSNILLLGITIFMIGALLAGAQSSLLPLSAIFYPTACRAVGVSWMHGIGRIGAILGAFFGSLIFTFNLSLSGIFFILAIPTFISFIALSLKVMQEKAKPDRH